MRHIGYIQLFSFNNNNVVLLFSLFVNVIEPRWRISISFPSRFDEMLSSKSRQRTRLLEIEEKNKTTLGLLYRTMNDVASNDVVLTEITGISGTRAYT